MFVNKATLSRAVGSLYGTAGHLLKIWLTLKHMGMDQGASPVELDTSNSTPSLQRLFACGASDGRFFIPFAHTTRYLTMKHDAARSIIQTTVQRWASSGSVVTCDPTEFLDISSGDGTKLQVSPGRRYPFGLGIGESGFALQDGARVSVPISSFAVWYGRQTDIPDGRDPTKFLVEAMLRELRISPAEREVIFCDDNLVVETKASPLKNDEIFSVCERIIDGDVETSSELHLEAFETYSRRVRSMVSDLDQPKWLRNSPEVEVKQLLDSGSKAILLYGPPRTGKTRFIDSIFGRDSKDRCSIQIHDGWTYDHLVEGLKPDDDGKWTWESGPLKTAVNEKKKLIVLEEVNRTAFSQALGEVFSLLEDDYRGTENGITLRSGERFSIPKDTVFLMTMNTVDKSTEDIDDALLGRVAAVEFRPRAEDLIEMLTSNGLPGATREKLAQLFAEILMIYPLGHGYFAGLRDKVTEKQVVTYYKTRVRPVLSNFLGALKGQELGQIDNLVDELFANE